MPKQEYPWFQLVEGDELEQGDILENCPVFAPPPDLEPEDAVNAQFKWHSRDLIVISQSCDLVKGREKLEEVLFCPVYTRTESQFKSDQLENARKGRLPAYHLVAESSIPELNRESSSFGESLLFLFNLFDSVQRRLSVYA